MSRIFRSIVVLLGASGCALLVIPAAAQEPVVGKPPSKMVALIQGESSVLELPATAERVAINNEAIADVLVVSPTQLLVHGKQPGSTSMVVWHSGKNDLYTVTVDPTPHKQGPFLDILHQLVPEEDHLTAYEADGTIILSGKAKHPANLAKAAEAAAAMAGKVVNIADSSDPKQVLIEVRLAEVDRKLAKSLGIDYFVQNSKLSQSGFMGGSLVPQAPTTPKFGRLVDPKDILLSPAVKQLLELRGDTADLTIAIQALEEQGLVRILAEPNLLAMSGKEASFLAGGEFPIPVAQTSAGGGSTVTVEFKKFGVQLNFKPEVTAEDAIRLYVEPEVSVLDFGRAAVKLGGFDIPGLITRRTSTTVQMRSGETLVIGGLLSHNQDTTNAQVPLLGDIPVLGQLFKSEKFKNEETELVVLVTPRLITPSTVDLPQRYQKIDKIGEALKQFPLATPYPDKWADQLRQGLGESAPEPPAEIPSPAPPAGETSSERTSMEDATVRGLETAEDSS